MQTTLDPTARLIERTAEREPARTMQVSQAPVQPARSTRCWPATARKHDAIVSRELVALAGDVDLIVLAQVSMGRVADALGDAVAIPVLTSPRLGMQRLAERLALLDKPARDAA